MSRLSAAKLGSVREDELPSHEIQVDLRPSTGSKFGFAWPNENSPEAQQLPRRHNSHQEHPATNAASAEEETDSTPTNDLSQDETPAPASPVQHPNDRLAPSPSHPRLSRAFSMPLPSQLGYLQHPNRSNSGRESPSTSPLGGTPPTAEEHLRELSLELADSVQMAIQTLLQLSPPQLLDTAKEQFSACAVQIPTPSLSALLTSMKTLNYISANMRRFGSPAHDNASPTSSSPESKDELVPKDEFDIGELLQSVGDSLGGIAAEADVDLVLHHGDAMKHMGVKGDECGISYALSHVIHQVLTTTRRGDTIEIGLSIAGKYSSLAGDTADPPSTPSSSSSRRTSVSSIGPDSPVFDDDGPLVCTFDIAHKYFSSSVDIPFADNDPHLESLQVDAEPDPRASATGTRPEPQFDTAILRRLLKHIGGTLRPSLQPKLFSRGRRCELSVMLERGPLLSVLLQRSISEDDELSRQPLSSIRFASEPTLEELTSFAETLRGKKVAFYASSHGSFAHHLTRYLTAWGMDISHVPTDGVEEKDPAAEATHAHVDSPYNNIGSPPGLGIGFPGDVVPPIVDGVGDAPQENKPVSGEIGLSFVIIDDDVLVLRQRLMQHRAAVLPNLHLHPRKRPSLASNHRPRSSPSIRNTLLSAGVPASSATPFSPVPIVHFTSLSNYKLVKDAIQAVLVAPGSTAFLPEVIVIPKPAGPRRLLTALHTAVNKPVVDPFFSPIATSPMSPSGTTSPFLSGRKSAGGNSPSNASRGGAERSSRSPRESGTDTLGMLHPSSPLAISETLDYFPDAAGKKLGGNAASGLVIQSPDGRPAGIFFQPQSRTSSSRTDISATAMERERGAPRPGSQRSRRSSTRRSSAGQAELADVSDNATPKLQSPPVKAPALPDDIPAQLLPPSSRLHRPRLTDQTELTRSFKGKGRVAAVSPEQEEQHALSTAAWREVTQNLAKQPLTPLTPIGSSAESATEKVLRQSPTTDPRISPSRKTSHTGVPASMSRSGSSPTSPDARKPAARRTMPPKSPVVSTGWKSSKTMGNNIVPPISVLIVEDNAINQTILSTFMRRNKIKYEVAWNGREAVDKWRTGNFHLILMDIQMPVMDGIEATKEIRRLEKLENIGHFPQTPSDGSKRFAETPDSRPSSAASTPFRSQVIIVALTASSLQSDRVAALAAGCNDFLTKPVTNSWLNDKVIEWGSIKALQMWSELRPEVARNISHDQNAHAQAVANKLHVPPASTRRSPLSGGRAQLAGSASSMGSRDLAASTAKPASEQALRAGDRHSSDKDSSSSDSSPEQWPMSSDDEATQDPITEPPAVIDTPIRETIALPEPTPHSVTGEAALLNFYEESKQEDVARPTLLGKRAISTVSTSVSIASVMHDTPGVGGTSTDGLAAAGAAQQAVEQGVTAVQNTSGEKEDPPDH